MKILITSLMSMAILGGSAGGSYMFFKNTAKASGSNFSEISKAEIDSDKKSAAADLKNLKFVELDPMVLPIIDSKGVTQVITLVVAIEVTTDTAAQQVRNLTPRLKDAFIQDMYGVLNRKAAMEGGMLRVDRLKKRLTKISYKVLGEQDINQVLLQVVQQNPV